MPCIPRTALLWTLALIAAFAPAALRADETPLVAPRLLVPGNHHRVLEIDGVSRQYLVHVPPGYRFATPRVPLVLALHGAGMNGPMMVGFCGLNETADREGFLVAYPSGTGIGPFLTWNAGTFFEGRRNDRTDDVKFLSRVIDDLSSIAGVDPHRVYATGMSNGGMMCYRLAAELSDRIAAIAPVAGTVAIAESRPERPVPVIHFHGSRDNIVPFANRNRLERNVTRFRDVDESVRLWVRLNGCDETPARDRLSKEGDPLTVMRSIHANGRDGSEVVLVVIEGGGHTWPGRKPPVSFIGKSTTTFSANDLLWEFFQKHPLSRANKDASRPATQ